MIQVYRTSTCVCVGMTDINRYRKKKEMSDEMTTNISGTNMINTNMGITTTVNTTISISSTEVKIRIMTMRMGLTCELLVFPPPSQQSPLPYPP